VDLNQGLVDLVAVALVAALAPLVVALLPGPRIPQVVILLLGGVLIGPHVLGLAETSNIQLLSNIGLGFLFLLAGYELDPQLLRQRPGRLAILGWIISAVIAVGVTAGLGAAGYVRDYVPIGLALTTTALGTLLPILRDNDMLGGPFGQYVFAAGAAGELLPILIIAVFLTGRGNFIALASVALVGVLAGVLSAVPRLARSSTVRRIIREGQDATGQTTLRWAVVLLFLLLAIASRFGLDVVLGALLAGIVLRAWTRRFHMDTDGLEHKFDAVGYGIFIPIFFVSSGMTLDLKAISRDPLRLLVFFLLLLIVRGLPSLLVYRRALPVRQRVEMTFITATTLPLLIALVEIGQRDGVMLPANAAALVGAGVLSVLVYPLIAVRLHRSAPLTPADVGISADAAAGTSAPPDTAPNG
jgi:Kef-type K+ transport system membrane component KefB